MNKILEVKNLRIQFKSRPDKWAVDGVSFSMQPGDVLGLVGESGSGKSVTAMAISGLHQKSLLEYEGNILVDGKEMFDTDREDIHDMQGTDIAVVFQEPMTSLDPVMKVGFQVEEALSIHYPEMVPEEKKEKALEAMTQAGLFDVENVYNKYPHELSGGMLQRVCIAAAIISNPKLLVADEPTTALDVTTQQHIIDLLKKINKEKGTSILFISHNLAVVRALCSKVIVMQKGKIVEAGDIEQVYSNPQHPYTQKLLAAIPSRDKRY